jgi:hypothetical protein
VRLGLPSQGRAPKWLPDIWVPLPEPDEDAGPRERWERQQDRMIEAGFFRPAPVDDQPTP